MNTDRGTDEAFEQETFNVRAFVGLLVSLFVGVAGLFALSTIQALLGVGFIPAFAVVLAVEFAAAVGVMVSVLRLHRKPTFE
jgi:hypothetical protein